jgi:phosphohistidine phosphatase
MKFLYLVRHAKSSWEDSAQNDYDRPLNERGERDAPVMGHRLKKLGILPDLILSSSAVRAATTASTISQIIGYSEKHIQFERRLYLAGELQLLHLLKEFGKGKTVMMVGHNPGLTLFANKLLKDNIQNIPTCGIVGAELTIADWKEAGWGSGHRNLFDAPKGIHSD